MSRGGHRIGAGRKKGFAAIEAQKSREYISQRVGEALEPIMNVLLTKAQSGDLKAIRELLDRAYGRPLLSSEIKHKGISENKIVFVDFAHNPQG